MLGGTAALLAAAVALPAQTESTPAETVELPSFVVTSTKDPTEYVGKEALSTTRTGVMLINLPQSVQVLNRAFIEDKAPVMLGDLLKFVGGAQTGNLNFSVDRFMIRGFTGESDYQDGFRASQSESQADMSVVDRVEIIKGPSAILIANGPVGGVINKISKSPVDYEVGSLKVQAGMFDANRIELDLGGPITADKKLQYRLIAAGQYSDGWYDNTYVHRVLVAPALAYDFGPQTRLTVRYSYVNTKFSSYNGIVLDLRTNTIVPVPPKTTYDENAPLNWRTDLVNKLFLEFSTRLNDVVAFRLAGLASTTQANRIESILSAVPATYTGGLLPRSTTAIDNSWPRRTLQMDFVLNFNTGSVKHKLLLGGDATDNTTHAITYGGTSSPIDPFNPVFPGVVTVNTSVPTSDQKVLNQFGKLYFLETANFFKDRLQLTVGGSRNLASADTTNRLTNTGGPVIDVYQNLGQWGAIFKPTAHTSVFYGFNENFNTNIQNNIVLPSQRGKQQEIGVKGELLDGKITTTLAYFDIKQVNLTAPSFPQTTPPSFVLVSGENSKGFDGDFTFEVNKNITVLASFASFRARVPLTAQQATVLQPTTHATATELPVGNVSEETFGAWGRYMYTQGGLKGFAFGAGLSYQSKKAITSSANDLFFGYVPGRTVIDAFASYDHGPFKYTLNVDNLLDKSYIYAARNQNLIIPGSGINVKGAVTWKF